jgi:hypothetical protein
MVLSPCVQYNGSVADSVTSDGVGIVFPMSDDIGRVTLDALAAMLATRTGDGLIAACIVAAAKAVLTVAAITIAAAVVFTPLGGRVA